MTIKTIIFSQLNSRFGKLGIKSIVIDFNLKQKTAVGTSYFINEKKDISFIIDENNYNMISSLLIAKILDKLDYKPKEISVVVDMVEQDFILIAKDDDNLLNLIEL